MLDALEHMIKQRDISLIVPSTVLDEFHRNKNRVAETEIQSLSSAIKRVKSAAWELGAPKQRRRLWERLNDLDVKLPTLGEGAVKALGRIEKLLVSSEIVHASDATKVRAAQRALEGRAPFHHGKNSIADAIIIETYADCVMKRAAGIRFAFVSHNKRDFSVQHGDEKQPHPDIAALFSKVRSLYFIELPAALRRINPGLVSEQLLLHRWSDEPRSATEISAAIEELITKIWYDRHQVTRQKIERGWVKIVEEETYPRPHGRGRETIQRDVWEGAQRSAKRVEKRYGLENLGPWSKFDWGMMNGKVSALRWVLGEDWDELYT